ncbi:MAG TPA: hypothetical protein DHW34_05390 [Actinobacteria bacterium]|nr:hypothetical protein [Actinomycetota bacterium]
MSTSFDGAALTDAALAACPPGIDMVAIAERAGRANLRWARNNLTTNGCTAEGSLTIIAINRDTGAVRTASRTQTGPTTESAAQLSARVASEASTAPPRSDEESALPDGSADADFATSAPAFGPQVLDPLVAGLSDTLTASSPDDAQWSGYAEACLDSTWLSTTAGTRRVHHQSTARFETTRRSIRGDGQVVSTWAGRSSEAFSADTARSAAAQATAMSQWAAQDAEVDPGRHRVLLTGEAFADLAIYAMWSASARGALEGSNAFSLAEGGTKLGQAVVSPRITVSSGPDLTGITTMPFVVEHTSGPNSSVLDNGEAVPTTTWIDHGVLQHLIGSRSLQRSLPQARRASDNIAIDGSGTGTLNDLIARTEDALLITSLWYIREVDPQSMLLTGLTRDGVYRIRDGQIVGSAPNFRFNASPLDVMSRVTDATTNQRVQPREWGDYVFRVSAPAILSEDFNLSTRSDAR